MRVWVSKGATFEVLSYNKIVILDKILDRLGPPWASKVQNSQRYRILKLNFWKTKFWEKIALKFLSEKIQHLCRTKMEGWIELWFAAFERGGFPLLETLKITKPIFSTQFLEKSSISETKTSKVQPF